MLIDSKTKCKDLSYTIFIASIFVASMLCLPSWAADQYYPEINEFDAAHTEDEWSQPVIRNDKDGNDCNFAFNWHLNLRDDADANDDVLSARLIVVPLAMGADKTCDVAVRLPVSASTNVTIKRVFGKVPQPTVQDGILRKRVKVSLWCG